MRPLLLALTGMYHPRFAILYRIFSGLAFLSILGFLFVNFFEIDGVREYEDKFLISSVLSIGLAGITGFFSGQKFVVMGRPNLYLPKAGTEKDDERRAWGLTIAIFYLCLLLGAVVLNAS